MTDERVEKGPTAWRNWQVHAGPSDDDLPRWFESAVYSDCAIQGLEVAAGPYRFLNTLAHAGSGGGPAVVLRTEWQLVFDVDPSIDETDESRYVGGTSDDEMAALLSLSLGRRFRAGGRIREWSETDPLGRPLEYDRHPQVPLGSPRGRVIPQLGDLVDIGSGRELLARYGDLRADDAVRLARAARLYADALWVADSDPNTAWLWLVGAVEAASKTPARGKVTRRFLDFLERHQPPPPTQRAPWTRIDWERLPELLRSVYAARSNALHDGKPFPAPMLEVPRWETNEDNEPDERPPSSGHIERPDGIASFSHGGTWASADIPMLLWVFEHVVRGSLLSWWRALPVR